MSKHDKIQVPAPPDPPEGSHEADVPQVLTAEVAFSSDRLSLLLGFEGPSPSSSPARHSTTHLLSLPAAARLARVLQQHVDEYLYGDELEHETESQ